MKFGRQPKLCSSMIQATDRPAICVGTHLADLSPMVRLAGNGRGENHLAIRALSMTGVPKGKAQDRLAQADLSFVIR